MAARRQKIGVLTFHRSVNYGSYWQARSLVEALRARGHDAELLDHDCKCIRRAEAKCALQPKLPQRTSGKEMPQYRAKARKFADAVGRLPLSRRFSLHAPEAAGEFDAVVVGSDEVWNFRHPWYGSKPIFFGDGLKAGRLVSYAASFGNHSAWEGMHPAWAEKLQRFSAISVRDGNSWHLVRNSIDREPTIVLDPCLLFPDLAAAERGQSTRSYAIVYGHQFPDWLAAKVRRWSEWSGIRLVSVGYSNDWADEQCVSAGPVEFARMVGGARAVVTNFFHGCVFALLHGKPWVTSPSDYRAIKIPDLADLLGAQQRLVSEETPDAMIAELLGTPMRAAVASRLEELRGRSQAYLDEALS
jgi:hypothetical protein